MAFSTVCWTLDLAARATVFAAGLASTVIVSASDAGLAQAPTATVPKSPPARLSPTKMTRIDARFEPTAFAALPGWGGDDHRAAFQAFLASCSRLTALVTAKSTVVDASSAASQRLLALCSEAMRLAPSIKTSELARGFFEERFVPHRVVHAGPSGLLTGYYEPVIKGARIASLQYPEPIYRRPLDLVNLVSEAQRGAAGPGLTHVRKTPAGTTEPYFTRAEIDAGALKAHGLELIFLPDPVEVFFLQVQGSGQIELADGTRVRVAYDGKNGHPYTSIGRYLIDQGIIGADRMSLQALGDWLRADLPRGRDVMRQNKSYVFFRELRGAEAQAPLGVMEIPLTTGRSLAVDPAFHTIGLPVYVSSSALTHATPSATGGFHRLMIAQDVGSAIKGPERGDIYFGTGPDAGKLAGVTKHPGAFFVLLPRAEMAADRATSAMPAKSIRAP